MKLQATNSMKQFNDAIEEFDTRTEYIFDKFDEVQILFICRARGWHDLADIIERGGK